MRLSEAIQLGSMLKPQWFGAMWSGDHDAVCALGAASEAVGLYDYPVHAHPVSAAIDALARVFPELRSGPALPCPACTEENSNLAEVIMCLNDVHRWTREAIAAWVAERERRGSPPSVDAVDPHAIKEQR